MIGLMIEYSQIALPDSRVPQILAYPAVRIHSLCSSFDQALQARCPFLLAGRQTESGGLEIFAEPGLIPIDLRFFRLRIEDSKIHGLGFRISQQHSGYT